MSKNILRLIALLIITLYIKAPIANNLPPLNEQIWNDNAPLRDLYKAFFIINQQFDRCHSLLVSKQQLINWTKEHLLPQREQHLERLINDLQALDHNAPIEKMEKARLEINELQLYVTTIHLELQKLFDQTTVLRKHLNILDLDSYLLYYQIMHEHNLPLPVNINRLPTSLNTLIPLLEDETNDAELNLEALSIPAFWNHIQRLDAPIQIIKETLTDLSVSITKSNDELEAVGPIVNTIDQLLEEASELTPNISHQQWKSFVSAHLIPNQILGMALQTTQPPLPVLTESQRIKRLTSRIEALTNRKTDLIQELQKRIVRQAAFEKKLANQLKLKIMAQAQHSHLPIVDLVQKLNRLSCLALLYVLEHGFIQRGPSATRLAHLEQHLQHQPEKYVYTYHNKTFMRSY